MQEIVTTKNPSNELKGVKLSLQDNQKLVDAFVWLIQEDKKQNPLIYIIKKENKND